MGFSCWQMEQFATYFWHIINLKKSSKNPQRISKESRRILQCLQRVNSSEDSQQEFTRIPQTSGKLS